MVVANRAARAIAGIDADTLRAMYRHMLRSRMLDERIWLLNRQGLARFWVSGMGQEAIQVALGMHVRPGHDWVAPYYRDLALTLVLGMTPRDQLFAALAKADDPNTGGRQMPAHFGCRRLQIITTGSVVATGAPEELDFSAAMAWVQGASEVSKAVTSAVKYAS